MADCGVVLQKRRQLLSWRPWLSPVARVFAAWVFVFVNRASNTTVEARFDYRTCLISALTFVATPSGSGA